MELTTEQTQKIIEEMMPDLKAKMLDQVSKAASWEVSEKCKALVLDQVTEFIEKEVMPEVAENLLSQKGFLIESAIKFSEISVDILKDAMAEQLKKSLSNSWSREKLFKAMFTE